MYYLYGILARTTKNEPTMQEKLQLRSLKLGLYCIGEGYLP
jgi:hypothetical protein